MFRTQMHRNIKDLQYIIHQNENDINTLRVLLKGPSDKPYKHKFFLFEIKIPNNYPFANPSVKFLPFNMSYSIHPNLYNSGKVCLSILGTWRGPSWNPTLNLHALILTIQSILTEDPLENEPGLSYSTETNIEYKHCVEYTTWKLLIEYLENINIIAFREFILSYLHSNKENVLTDLEKLLEKKIRLNHISLSSGRCPQDIYYESIYNYINNLLTEDYTISEMLSTDEMESRYTNILSTNITGINEELEGLTLDQDDDSLLLDLEDSEDENWSDQFYSDSESGSELDSE